MATTATETGTLTWQAYAWVDGNTTCYVRRIRARNAAEAYTRWEQTLIRRGLTPYEGGARLPMALNLD